MSASPYAGAEMIYAVRCDLVQNSISVFAVGALTVTVGSVKPLITTFILFLALTTQCHVSEDTVKLNESPFYQGIHVEPTVNEGLKTVKTQ